jgi:hypothetical protein
VTDCNIDVTTTQILSTYNDLPVTAIGEDAFRYCTNLTSIIVPEGILRIEESAFSNCSNLTTITLPNSLTSIGMGAFNKCTKLTSIDIPSSVTDIGLIVFYGCTYLTSITVDEGNETYKNDNDNRAILSKMGELL